jgi:hypothetical protein
MNELCELDTFMVETVQYGETCPQFVINKVIGY